MLIRWAKGASAVLLGLVGHSLAGGISEASAQNGLPGSRSSLELGGGETSPGTIAALTTPQDTTSVGVLTHLGARQDRDATELLLLAAADDTIIQNGELLLALVTALDRHCHSSRSPRVVRALMRAATLEISSRVRVDDTSSRGQWDRARASAMFSLARCRAPEGLSLLIAHAASSDELDRAGAEAARDALFTVSRDLLSPQNLDYLVDQQLLDRALSSKAGPFLPKSPSALVALASSDFETWRISLEQLASKGHLSGIFNEIREWELSFEKDRAFTLRTLACLRGLLSAELEEQAIAWAEEALRSKDANVRSAGAFSLAVLSPDAAARNVDWNDRVAAAAALAQAESPALARSAAQLASNKRAPRDLVYVARHASAWSSALASSQSSRQLWARSEGQPIMGFRAELAARMISSAAADVPSGRSITVAEARDWLDNGESELRSAAARGLGRSKSPSAAGLLLRAYRLEGSPEVRRAITSAMSRHPEIGSKLTALTTRLDPDLGVRERAGLQVPQHLPRFRVALSSQSRTSLTDGEGRRLWFVPAPDGFVGFVDPRGESPQNSR